MKRIFTVGAVAAIAALAACGNTGEASRADDGAAVERIRLAVAAATFGPAQSPYTSLPQALGYWEEEGLDVEVLGFAGSGLAVQNVVAGQADAGLAAPTTLFPAITKGAELKAVFNQITRNAYVPEVSADSSIRTMADLQGKTVGVTNLEANGIPLTKGAMKEEGLDPDSVEFVAVGAGAEALNFLRSNRVDALALYDSVYGEIEALGQDLRPVGPEWFKELTLHQAVFASNDLLEDNPDAVMGLARGIAKAMAFADENPEAAVKIHWEVYPESKPTGVDEEKALAQAVRILERRNENTGPVDGVWGGANADQLTAMTDFLVSSGLVEDPVDPAQVWTSELLDAVNDFDEDAVRKAARDWAES